MRKTIILLLIILLGTGGFAWELIHRQWLSVLNRSML